MRKFLIAGHGQFASGLKSALDIIAGEIDRVWTIDAYVDENKPIEREVQDIVSQLNPGDELIVLTDLMGGSITNQVIRSVDLKSVYVLSGVNFPVLIDLVMSDPDTPTAEAIESALTIGREQLVHVNRLIDNPNTHD
jgi:fructoselysine and glucoselysine-specific PTS system IIA component